MYFDDGDCGYDPSDEYEEGLAFGKWIQKCGTPIYVHEMTLSHLKGAKRIAERAADYANFSNVEEMWNEWVQVFDDEISRRPAPVRKPATAPKAPPRGAMQQMKCFCGIVYPARKADLKRGWGLTCSKSCAAIRRDYGRPAAKKVAE